MGRQSVCNPACVRTCLGIRTAGRLPHIQLRPASRYNKVYFSKCPFSLMRGGDPVAKPSNKLYLTGFWCLMEQWVRCSSSIT